MLTAKQIQELKRVNVSKDAEKSKIRIAEDFKSTTRSNKNTIIELSGLRRHTFYRVFATGTATAKVVLSMAQTLNVSPYYYIGMENEKGECSEEIVAQFLREFGYKRIAKEMENTKYDVKTVSSFIDPSIKSYESSNDLETISISFNNSQKMQEAIVNLDEESAVLLLKALFLRAEVNANAEALSNLVKRCLLL